MTNKELQNYLKQFPDDAVVSTLPVFIAKDKPHPETVKSPREDYPEWIYPLKKDLIRYTEESNLIQMVADEDSDYGDWSDFKFQVGDKVLVHTAIRRNEEDTTFIGYVEYRYLNYGVYLYLIKNEGWYPESRLELIESLN